MLYFRRDDNNHLIGFDYNNEKYYYKKNNQNDIIGIYNSEYEEIASYEYDSYGRILKVVDENKNIITDETHIAMINPYRYRSYYYDEETNLYYLNSRYYNPVWKRFINRDGIIGASDNYLGYNLYAYCNNNPVVAVDSSGAFFNIVAGVVRVAKIIKNVTTIVSSVIGLIGNLPISSSMLNKSINKPTGKIDKKTTRKVINKVKKSSEMKSIVNSCISQNKNNNQYICEGSTNFLTDTDLKLSIGKANYTIDGFKNPLTDKTMLQISINDTYDFTEKREWNSISNIANNFGYYAQNFKLITPYEWDITYVTTMQR